MHTGGFFRPVPVKAGRNSKPNYVTAKSLIILVFFLMKSKKYKMPYEIQTYTQLYNCATGLSVLSTVSITSLLSGSIRKIECMCSEYSYGLI